MDWNFRSVLRAFWRSPAEAGFGVTPEEFELRSELNDAVERPVAQPVLIDSWVQGGKLLESRGAVGAKLAPWITSHPVYPKQTYRAIIQQGYYGNELIYSGLNLLVKMFSQAFLEVYDHQDQPIPGHALSELVKAPSREDYEYGLWEWTLLDLYLTGNAIWEKVRRGSGEVVEIWRLEPERIAIFPDPVNLVSHYLYEVGGIWYRIPRRNVLHWKFPNPGADPLDRFFGFAPIIAAWRSLMTDNEMTDFTKTTMQNLAVPPIVVEAQQKIDEGFAKRFQDTWKERYGKGNRGKPAVLQQGMTVKTVGMNMSELAFPVLREIMETRVLMNLGGAPLLYLLGTHAGMQRAIYNNYSEARDALAEDVVGPLWSRFGSALTRFLLPEFDKSGRLRAAFNTSRVIAIEERRMKRVAQATEAVKTGVVTRDEGRALAGYAGLGRNGQDELYVPITVNRVQVQDGEVDEIPRPLLDEADESDFGESAEGSSGSTRQQGAEGETLAEASVSEEDQDLELPGSAKAGKSKKARGRKSPPAEE